MQDFRKLIAWQRASALEDRLDPIVQRIGKQRPALADQISRAAASITANIAEGCGRESKADFRRFLTQSIGSSTELESHLIRALRFSLITQAEHDSLVADVVLVRKPTHGLRKRLLLPNQ
jgi:four helix bundle protein